MVVFPNCKINLGLHILNKREDGYHNIETVFYPVPLKDALEIIPSGNTDAIQFTSSGLTIRGDAASNLCIKAYHLLKKDYPTLPGIKIHLHKAIPMGAGLGGGSANAAFTLQLLNKQFQLNLSTTELIDYSLQLGSDCPFFILNEPCIANGRGEILNKIDLNLSAYQLMLINPGIHVNTAGAFGYVDLQKINHSAVSLNNIINQPLSQWQQLLTNHFEKALFNKYPLIKEIKETLYTMGASYAAMSGSGSTVYGLFEKKLKSSTNFDPRFFVHLVSL